MRVLDLLPGDEVTRAGMTGVFLTRNDHPVYHGLQLVVWALPNGVYSFDALALEQEVGDCDRRPDHERRQRWREAVNNNPVVTIEPGGADDAS